MQMPAAGESVGDSEGQIESQLALRENTPLRPVALSGFRLSNPSRDAEEVLSGFLKINTACYCQKKKLSVIIAIRLASLRLSVSHNTTFITSTAIQQNFENQN